MVNDNVNSPAHYNQQPYEAIDFIESMENPMLANAFKYVWRAKHKGNAKEDYEKALWYVKRWKKWSLEGEKIDGSYSGALKKCNFTKDEYKVLLNLWFNASDDIYDLTDEKIEHEADCLIDGINKLMKDV